MADASAPFVTSKLNTAQFRATRRALQTAPPKIKKNIVQRWNVSALDFRRLMQRRHLSGGTTKDRLARRTSTLYNSLRHEAKLTRSLIQVSVWFLDTVSDYAPTHEYGDPDRNIPARMNLRRKWREFRAKFFRDAREGMEEGLRDA